MRVNAIVVDFCASDESRRYIVVIDDKTKLFLKICYDAFLMEEVNKIRPGDRVCCNADYDANLFRTYTLKTIESVDEYDVSLKELMELKSAHPMMVIENSVTGNVFKVKTVYDLIETGMGIQIKARVCGFGERMLTISTSSASWMDYCKGLDGTLNQKKDEIIKELNHRTVYFVTDFERIALGGCLDCMGMVMINE